MSDLSGDTEGARLMQALRAMKPGERYRLPLSLLKRVSVPADPLDRQTPEYLVNWLHARMPFYCTIYRDEDGRFWEICRPSSLLRPPSKAKAFDVTTAEGARRLRDAADYYRKTLRPFA